MASPLRHQSRSPLNPPTPEQDGPARDPHPSADPFTQVQQPRWQLRASFGMSCNRLVAPRIFESLVTLCMRARATTDRLRTSHLRAPRRQGGRHHQRIRLPSRRRGRSHSPRTAVLKGEDPTVPHSASTPTACRPRGSGSGDATVRAAMPVVMGTLSTRPMALPRVRTISPANISAFSRATAERSVK